MSQVRSLEDLAELGRKVCAVEPVLLEGKYSFTKDREVYLRATFVRRLDLEVRMQAWVASRVSADMLLSRLSHRCRLGERVQWPQHFPVQIVDSDYNVALLNNVFLYFPFGAGLRSEEEQHIFGFELVAVSIRIFNEVHIPALEIIGSKNAKALVEERLSKRLEEVVCLYSLLHEMCHRVGVWRVIPSKDKSLCISGKNLAIVGELWADLQLVENAKEFPELMLFIFLNRIFWYARKGYSVNVQHGDLNSDNDAWGGVYLWVRLRDAGALSINQVTGKLDFELDAMADVFSACYWELEELGASCLAAGAEGDALVNQWKLSVLSGALEQQVLPFELQGIYALCRGVPESFH
ncbi:Unknown protein sequence [Pseudomonas syringae pv. helianthi]|uniref:Uncharacterized protein n=2 Tax=Pseudomonas syringae group genomosp. 7 TaxID=251699 RepID=A0A0P9R830_9PSED|nr:Unknown protein sequence [Pseudomonas syringae pv. helianthi]RMR03078.1 hypothetical protein ALP93_200337 [Pseudomonas syringae pv. helianthi]RMW15986.1 hypothetical protein ALO98_200230 [Pseudomonas syringae pv. tagetis]RMW16758.1 hypothetical protein ALO97_04223 [Pseudomonas syringae pv. tagetis]